MKKLVLGVLTAVLFTIFQPAVNSFADIRSYVWTYEYQTKPKDEIEFEYYLTTAVPDSGQSNINTWQHWVEAEYGLTDRWDVGLYQMFTQKNTGSSSSLEYDGFKIETKYRIGEKNQFLLDPLLYFEYIRDDDLSKPNVGEAKLVLAKDIGRFNLSYNQIVERNIENKGKTEHEYAAGLNYAFTPLIKFGVESKGSYTNREYAFGPSLSLEERKFWVSFGAVFGLNDKTDDIQTRMIVGMDF